MTIILLCACIGMIAGSFLILGITPTDFTGSVFGRILQKPKSLRDEVNEDTGRKKAGRLRREITEVQTILALTGRANTFPALCAISLALCAGGAALAIMLDNAFLVPVLALGFMLLPFWYVRLTQTGFKRQVSSELETALSIITTAYLRSEDIQTAVEENISYINQPVKSAFQAFLSRIKLVDPDMDTAILALKDTIDNGVFHEWCDAVLACQHDRSLKTTLTPIVTKLSDTRVVNGELDGIVFAPRKEFIVMVALVLLNIPMLYMLNKDWYATLMHTIPGQIVLALCAAAIFVCSACVIRVTKPIEYKR